MNIKRRDELEQRLTGYDAEALRVILLDIARHDLCLVVSTLNWADWHIQHPELCSQRIPALEEHTTRATQRLAETGRIGAAEGTAPVRRGGGDRA